MFSNWIRAGAAMLVGTSICLGCSSSKESASRDKLTASVGQYPAAPQGVNKPRVGVPAFAVTTGAGMSGEANLDGLAADQMTTLLGMSNRFHVIERAQLQKLIDEQNLEGIVKPGELAKQGQVRGVDFLLLGKVTNLRVKREQKGNEFGVAQVGGLFNVGGADIKNNSTVITTECGVDIRLVNPTTGETFAPNFSEYKRTDSAKSMGLAILGANAQSNADVSLSEDDKGKILRLALNDALLKDLPAIDNFLRNQPATPAANFANPGVGANAAATPANNAANPAGPNGASNAAGAPPAAGTVAAAGKKFCPECGTANALDAKFCSKCGHKLE
ncbi:MAG TPA: CsgG/HfaB family protein [Tepidisphaeraceae bacterium]|nr:CsgG/HfaB family protein [Tepidisphaeraceae bacterium]